MSFGLINKLRHDSLFSSFSFKREEKENAETKIESLSRVSTDRSTRDEKSHRWIPRYGTRAIGRSKKIRVFPIARAFEFGFTKFTLTWLSVVSSLLPLQVAQRKSKFFFFFKRHELNTDPFEAFCLYAIVHTGRAVEKRARDVPKRANRRSKYIYMYPLLRAKRRK